MGGQGHGFGSSLEDVENQRIKIHYVYAFS